MIIDITGTVLIPGDCGKNCPGRIICCDECDFLACCLDNFDKKSCENCKKRIVPTLKYEILITNIANFSFIW